MARRPFISVLLVLVVVTIISVFISDLWTSTPQPLYKQIIAAESNYYQFPYQAQVRLWIDVPNTFPWRECLHLKGQLIHTHPCHLTQNQHMFIISPDDQDKTRIKMKVQNMTNDYSWECVQPASHMQEVHVGDCSEGYWRWSRDGLLEWSDGGYCLASKGSRERVHLSPCDVLFDDQAIEFGVEVEDDEGNNIVLQPIDILFWEERMRKRRNKELKLAKVEVNKTLKDADNDIKRNIQIIDGNRRAVVFYVDRGSGFLKYLTWWIHTWKLIGLDSEEEAFDIILMTHPESIAKLPDDCTHITKDFDPKASGPGKCLYKELVGISERDHRYDIYINSQECLFNPAASFLQHYRLLLRADMDTFPTPGLLGYWPKDVICNRNAVYAGTIFHREDIEGPIREAAKAAGIEHKHWHNTDSAWFGPTKRIIALSKLTTSLARFVRAHMFGPGTKCRCATCITLPESCQWGKGIYAGTLLLYAQEIAMNKIWTQREYDEQKYDVLDASCSDSDLHICNPVLLHARHIEEPFSKFTFIKGGYEDWDLGTLDITNVRDYAMYMAITSAGQGRNQEQGARNYQKKEKGVSLNQVCKIRNRDKKANSSVAGFG